MYFVRDFRFFVTCNKLIKKHILNHSSLRVETFLTNLFLFINLFFWRSELLLLRKWDLYYFFDFVIIKVVLFEVKWSLCLRDVAYTEILGFTTFHLWICGQPNTLTSAFSSSSNPVSSSSLVLGSRMETMLVWRFYLVDVAVTSESSGGRRTTAMVMVCCSSDLLGGTPEGTAGLLVVEWALFDLLLLGWKHIINSNNELYTKN